MHQTNKLAVFFLSCLLILSGCGGNTQKIARENETSQSATKKASPPFNADSAYHYVASQVAFGPRIPGTDIHGQCADWLIDKLGGYTDTIIVQSFRTRIYNRNTLDGKNIIEIFNPLARKRILLAAHWDTRPFADHDADPANRRAQFDGANDGASGVGVLLEAARLIQSNPLNEGLGIDIIFFDLEDYGPPTDMRSGNDEAYWALGAQHWSRNPHQAGYHAQYGILLDMVGAKGAVFPREYYSQQYASWVLDKVWRTAYTLGYGDYFVNRPGPPISDDHIPVNRIAGIPMINIIHLDTESSNGSFFEHWHTVQDNMEQIDPKTLKMVGEVLMANIYSE